MTAQPIAIKHTGLITSVGLSAPAACAALTLPRCAAISASAAPVEPTLAACPTAAAWP